MTNEKKPAEVSVASQAWDIVNMISNIANRPDLRATQVDQVQKICDLVEAARAEAYERGHQCCDAEMLAERDARTQSAPNPVTHLENGYCADNKPAIAHRKDGTKIESTDGISWIQSAPERCKHDVHGTDCWECYPSYDRTQGAPVAGVREEDSEVHVPSIQFPGITDIKLRKIATENAQLICDQSKGAFTSVEGMADLLYSMVHGVAYAVSKNYPGNARTPPATSDAAQGERDAFEEWREGRGYTLENGYQQDQIDDMRLAWNECKDEVYRHLDIPQIRNDSYKNGFEQGQASAARRPPACVKRPSVTAELDKRIELGKTAKNIEDALFKFARWYSEQLRPVQLPPPKHGADNLDEKNWGVEVGYNSALRDVDALNGLERAGE